MSCNRLQRLGIQRGDILAIQLEAGPSWLSLFFDAIELGAIVCPFPIKAPPLPLLNRIKPKCWIDPSGKAHLLDRQSTSFPNISLLLFTSGSSGTPKIAAFSFNALLESAKHVVDALAITSKDTLQASLPLHHVGGIGILLRSFLSKARLSFQKQDPSSTILSYVPTQLYRAWPVQKGLRACLLGGAPLEHIPDELPIYATYGLTEMGSTVLLQHKPKKRNGRWYLGRPLPHIDMKLGADGEIFVRGTSLFAGYMENGALSSIDGFFPTKDLGLFDPVDGFAIVGRKDHLFISGGENIQPEEIEQALSEHPAIIQSIVAPKIDAEFGALPAVCVETIRPISLSEIREFLSDKLPKHKIPVSLHKLPPNDLKPDRKKIFQIVNSSYSNTLK